MLCIGPGCNIFFVVCLLLQPILFGESTPPSHVLRLQAALGLSRLQTLQSGHSSFRFEATSTGFPNLGSVVPPFFNPSPPIPMALIASSRS